VESRLTDEDEREFLLRLFFGEVRDELRSAIRSAYSDFKRTLRGFQRYADRSSIKPAADEVLYDAMSELLSTRVSSQDVFDAWHKTTCDNLRSAFGGFNLYYGQAQKWINMSLKYLFVLERARVAPYWQYCHIPIDYRMLRRLERHAVPRFSSPAWSKIDSYEEYMHFQSWFRAEFEGIPMDNEWRLWLGPN